MAANEGFRMHFAETVKDARAAIRSQRMDLLLLDLQLPDGSGMDILDDIDLTAHGLVALVTGHPSVESAAASVSMPVSEYLIKPLDPEQLSHLLRRAKRCRTSIDARPAAGLAGIVGDSPAMQRVLDTVRRIGPTEASVLLQGETGTGKEIVARALHDVSRRPGPIVALNCGAVPSELLASQLFGHEKGSFTGAHARQPGVFEQAAHGTLLLDEITEMPPSLQVYLLRIVESGAVTRLGGARAIEAPVRIIAATNRDPLAAIAEGRLREDLYYRLADIAVVLPPLRERGGDVTALAQMYVERLNARYGGRKRLSAQSEAVLLKHHWPGNVRELRSAVQRAFLLQAGDVLDVRPGPAPAPVPREDAHSIVFTVGTTLEDLQRHALRKTLDFYDNDKTAAARALGISVRTIHNHLARAAAPVSPHAGKGSADES
ncbi:MAG: sigma 54-interacting transcriptional regulator [Luteimonas sp.]